MQRYRDSSLNIESFRLRRYQYYNDVHKANMITGYLIADAMKIGATDVLLDIPRSVSLPQEVLGSQTLVRLSLINCRLIGEYMIRCLGLQELSLSRCAGLALPNLYKLRRLVLHHVDVETLFSSDDIASRFPCLKDLSIRSCGGLKRIKISSTSLQTISFKPIRGSWRARFDVPNIRTFTLSVSCLPSRLSIKAAPSREWKFDISIACSQLNKSSWFLKLKEYLRKFKLSRITLSIRLRCGRLPDEVDTQVEGGGGGEPLVVENLMIDVPSSFCSAILIKLFEVFRPKFITHYWVTDECAGWFLKSESVDILCMRLMMKPIAPNCGIPNQNMFGKFNLAKVKVEVYEMFNTEWRPLVLENTLDASKAPANKRKVRFELIWGMN